LEDDDDDDDVACQCVTMKPPTSATGYGVVTSPNFPRVYSPGINCVLYSIIAGDDQLVELQFVDFSMAPPIRNRCDRLHTVLGKTASLRKYSGPLATRVFKDVMFVPRDAMLARYMLSSYVRPFVRHKSVFYKDG